MNTGLMTDASHYTVSATHDSTFVKYLKFDLSDSSIAKITYTLTNVTTGVQQAQSSYLLGTANSTNLMTANNYIRNHLNVKIGFGYFPYQGKKFLANISLYNSSNTLLSSTNYNFNH